MDYYCVMVFTGEEKTFKERANQLIKPSFPESEFFVFERKLFTNRRGWFDAVLFPGYVFFGTSILSADFFDQLKKIDGFCRILRDNQHPVKFTGEALEELKVFINNGESWGVSKVKFLPGQKIHVVSGPLVGLEGNIVAVNKKRKRITVQTNITSNSMRFDLLFEDAEVVSQ